MNDQIVIDNSDGLFTGLRQSQNKNSKCTIQFADTDVKWQVSMMDNKLNQLQNQLDRLLSMS